MSEAVKQFLMGLFFGTGFAVPAAVAAGLVLIFAKAFGL